MKHTFKNMSLFILGTGLRYYVLFSSCGEGATLGLWAHGLQFPASPVVERRPQGVQASEITAHGLKVAGICGLQTPEGVAHRFSCPAACGIFLDQGTRVPCIAR